MSNPSPIHPNRVVVGMSGGVDSSVAAFLLKEQGLDVVGLFMKNWEDLDPDSGLCTAAEDFRDVIKVCDQIGMPYYSIEFIEEYRNNVFAYFVDAYQKGLTPNPDILCNREIKFDLFYKKAMSLGAGWLATGHYAQLVDHPTWGRVLTKGADPNKDQTYFIYAVNRDVFQNVLFPIGALPKEKVREIAKKAGLPTHAKKDSTGICFIGERKFREFLSQYIAIRPGEFQLLNGQRVGEHKGAAFYTLGQRRGMGLGGPGESWYVVGKNTQKNIVYVERGEWHPALFADDLEAGELNWLVPGFDSTKPFRCRAKSRYRQDDQECLVQPLGDGTVKVLFQVPQRALTAGQSVVFYLEDICLGGGVIQKVGPSYFEQGRSLPNHGAQIES